MTTPPSAGNPVKIGPYKRITDFHWPESTGGPPGVSYIYVQGGTFISTSGGFQGIACVTNTTELRSYSKVGDIITDGVIGTLEQTAFATPVFTPILSEDDPEYNLIENPVYAASGTAEVECSGLLRRHMTWRNNYIYGTQTPYIEATSNWSTARYSDGVTIWVPVAWRLLSSATPPLVGKDWGLEVMPT